MPGIDAASTEPRSRRLPVGEGVDGTSKGVHSGMKSVGATRPHGPALGGKRPRPIRSAKELDVVRARRPPATLACATASSDPRTLLNSLDEDDVLRPENSTREPGIARATRPDR